MRDNDFYPIQEFPLNEMTLRWNQQLNGFRFPIHMGISMKNRTLHSDSLKDAHDTRYHGFFQIFGSFFHRLQVVPQIHLHKLPQNEWLFFYCQRISWLPTHSLNLSVDYTEGLRFPTLGERFGFPFYPWLPSDENQQMSRQNHASSFIPNPELKPETSQKIMGSLSWQLGSKFLTHIQIYSQKIDHLIQVIKEQDHLLYKNQTHARLKGIQSTLRIGPWYGLGARIHVNWLDALDDQDNPLLERPHFWGTASLHWNHSFFQNDLLVQTSLTGRYWSDTWSLNVNTSAPELVYLAAGSTLSLKLALQIQKHFLLTAAVDNLFNSSIQSVSTYTFPMRNIRFGFHWELFD
jgi:hypothetical protein